MRKLKMGLAVLATSAAVFVPAGSANANLTAVDVCDWAGCNFVAPIEMAVGDNTVCGLPLDSLPVLMAGQWVSCNKPGVMARLHPIV
jgi:hypothetical protein